MELEIDLLCFFEFGFKGWDYVAQGFGLQCAALSRDILPTLSSEAY